MMTQQLNALQAQKIPKIRVITNKQARTDVILGCIAEETPISCENGNTNGFNFAYALLSGGKCSCINRTNAGSTPEQIVPIVRIFFFFFFDFLIFFLYLV